VDQTEGRAPPARTARDDQLASPGFAVDPTLLLSSGGAASASPPVGATCASFTQGAILDACVPLDRGVSRSAEARITVIALPLVRPALSADAVHETSARWHVEVDDVRDARMSRPRAALSVCH